MSTVNPHPAAIKENCTARTSAVIPVSVVVACRNEAHHIRRFLDSLLSQELSDLEWEAVIADGLSDDGTREILDDYSARFPQIRVIENAGRIVSSGLNSAIRAARGDIIIRMDAHTFYAPDYCSVCVETLKQTGADNVGGPARTIASGPCACAIAAAYHSRFSTGGAKFHDVSYEGWVDTVTYGCWRKSVFERIGLFDETLVRNQDDELNLRLVRAGGRIWQNPRIVSWYSPRPKLSSLFRQYFQYGFWKVAVIRKHKSPGSWRHAVPVLFVVANAVLAIGTAVAGIAGARGWLITAASVWALLIGTYAAANLLASAVVAHRCGWETLPYLPATFAAYHVSYGFGFLVGLMQRQSQSAVPDAVTANSVFSGLTR